MLATIVLHNFMMLDRSSTYFTEDLVDHEENGTPVLGTWREEIQPLRSLNSRPNRSSETAFEKRNTLKNYLMINN